MVRRFQRDSATALSRAIHGEVWSTTDQLLAALVDLTQVGNWQRAQKPHAPKPKPIKRPWEKPVGKQIGSKPIPMSQFDGWWDSQKKRK
ncbi:hypothetical protein A9Z40_03145 [Microbacterium arborescens]|uniref:Uncharacterized protein n=1 Tax=Microbacterium arborescens TaxID=33883 RepID=A0ABX2WIA5_9MICO|nr:hypothetical protein [Microbacterium arborescens]OAZ40951.1 hypothetical protein A9Z40_03145 [Microbacterium arborescens]